MSTFTRESAIAGRSKSVEVAQQKLAAFKEDRDFLRSFGMDDRKIAERFGISWETYRNKFRRHPELTDDYPLYDPVEIDARSTTDWTSILYPKARKR